MGTPCQYVFYFDADETTCEVVEDLDGEMTMPVKGDVTGRNGRQWKVVHVSTLHEGNAIPVHRVMLSSDLTLKIFP
jgi:hypothetical protein